MVLCSEDGGFTGTMGNHSSKYEFTIHYHKGHDIGNADALSRKSYLNTHSTAATSQAPLLTEDLHEQQLSNPTSQ